MHFTQGASLDRKILRVDVNGSSIHLTVAGNDTVTQTSFAFLVVESGCHCSDFTETAFIEQQVNAFTGSQTTFSVLLVNAGLSTT